MTRKLTYRDGMADARDFELPDRDRRRLCRGEVTAAALAEGWTTKLTRAQKSDVRSEAKRAASGKRAVSSQIRRYFRGMKAGVKAVVDSERKSCRR